MSYKKPFVTVELYEFEAMQKIISEKQDINIVIRLRDCRNLWDEWGEELSSYSVILDNNPLVPIKLMDLMELDSIINAALASQREKTKKKILEIEEELSSLKSKWYHKLFNLFK